MIILIHTHSSVWSPSWVSYLFFQLITIDNIHAHISSPWRQRPGSEPKSVLFPLPGDRLFQRNLLKPKPSSTMMAKCLLRNFILCIGGVHSVRGHSCVITSSICFIKHLLMKQKRLDLPFYPEKEKCLLETLRSWNKKLSKIKGRKRNQKGNTNLKGRT